MLATAALAAGLITAVAAPSQASAGDGTISGRVFSPLGKGKSNIQIVAYVRSGDVADPSWTAVPDFDEETRYDDSGKHPEVVGTYTVSLAPGTYRLAFNRTAGGTFAGSDYLSEFWDDSATLEGATDIVVAAGVDSPGHDATLAYSGGTISGTVTDAAGDPLSDIEVFGYHTDREFSVEDQPYYHDPNIQTTTNKDGVYTLRTRGKPVWLYFSQDNPNDAYAGEFYDDQASYVDATPVDAQPGDVLTGKNVVLTSNGLRNIERPSVQGDLVVDRRVHADAGRWTPQNLSFSYRWFRVSGSKVSRIKGATSSSYKITSASYDKRLRVEVRAKQSGVPAVTKTSRSSAVVKRGSSVSLSGSSPSRARVSLTAKVKVTDVSTATGKVKFTCGTNLFDYDSKTVKLSHGKATAKLGPPIPSGSQTCTARYYPSSSKIVGDTATKRIKVKG